ncbi:MAG TPA: hypothetical protein VLT45_23870 [Kofleriaceae bacterium]|nr:hypothetical protein [Kofleriaceae bacterium]
MRIALCLLLTSTAAHADTEIGVGTDVRALHSPSANALTDDSLFGGHVAFAHALLPNLWLTGAVTFGGATGTMFEMSTSVFQESLEAGVRARHHLAGPLAALARVDVGMSDTSVKLADPAYQTLSDHAWAPLASGALGVELAGRIDRRIDMGLRLELGYVACAPVTLAARTQVLDDGTNRLSMMQASLGSLDLSGKYAAASWLVRF